MVTLTICLSCSQRLISAALLHQLLELFILTKMQHLRLMLLAGDNLSQDSLIFNSALLHTQRSNVLKIHEGIIVPKDQREHCQDRDTPGARSVFSSLHTFMRLLLFTTAWLPLNHC